MWNFKQVKEFVSPGNNTTLEDFCKFYKFQDVFYKYNITNIKYLGHGNRVGLHNVRKKNWVT